MTISIVEVLLGGYECHQSKFQNPSFHILRRKPCPCRYFTIVFALVFVAVAVSIQSLCHLSPFHLSYVAVSRPCHLSEFTLTGPHCYSHIAACSLAIVGVQTDCGIGIYSLLLAE